MRNYSFLLPNISELSHTQTDGLPWRKYKYSMFINESQKKNASNSVLPRTDTYIKVTLAAIGCEQYRQRLTNATAKLIQTK